MTEPYWHYSGLRDPVVLKLLFAGAPGAVVAAMWIPLAWKTAEVALRTGNEIVFLLLFVLPICFLLLWTLVWWVGALKRILRLRRLARIGVPVQAAVQKMEIGRYRMSIMSVTLWLQYKLDGQTFDIKKKSTLRGLIAPARDLQRVDIAVDPESPKSMAFAVGGRLG